MWQTLKDRKKRSQMANLRKKTTFELKKAIEEKRITFAPLTLGTSFAFVINHNKH
jgi:hypothetical protein